MSEFNFNKRLTGAMMICTFVVLLISTSFAYSCTDLHGEAVDHWWTMDDVNTTGNTWYDSCGVLNATNSTLVPIVSSLWGESGDFELADSDEMDVGNAGAFDLDTGNFSICLWHQPETVPASRFALFGYIEIGKEYFIIEKKADNTFTGGGKDNAGANSCTVTSTTNAVAGNLYHLCYVMDRQNNTCSFWVNGTAEAWSAETGGDWTTDQITSMGYRRNGAGDNYADGTIDEVVAKIGGTAFNSTEIQGLFNNGVGFVAAGGGGGGTPTVTNNYPTNNDHDDNVTWTYTPTWYGADSFSTCELWANSTYRAANSTALVNATVNSISWTPGSDGFYQWYVNCTNSTPSYITSSTWGFYYDTTAPIVTINTPTGSPSYQYGASTNANISFSDNIDLFNCTIDIIDSLGATDYTTSVACSGTSYSWTAAEFTSTLDVDTYTLNASAVDSHTSELWVPESYEVIGKELKVKDKGEYSLSFVDSEDVSIETAKLEDRIKWAYRFTGDKQKWYRVRIAANSLTYLEDSPYAAHFVVNGRNWIDFQDLVETGFDVKVKDVTDTSAEVSFKLKVGEGTGEIYADPATGGLSFGSAIASFSITPIETELDVGVLSELVVDGINRTVFADYYANSSISNLTGAFNQTYWDAVDWSTASARTTYSGGGGQPWQPWQQINFTQNHTSGAELTIGLYYRLVTGHAGNARVVLSRCTAGGGNPCTSNSQVGAAVNLDTQNTAGWGTTTSTLLTNIDTNNNGEYYARVYYDGLDNEFFYSYYGTINGVDVTPGTHGNLEVIYTDGVNWYWRTQDAALALYVEEQSGGAVTGATCTATSTLESLSGAAMTYNATSERYEISFEELQIDGYNVDDVAIQCSRANYETQASTLSYYNDYWHSGEDYVILSNYEDTAGFTAREGISTSSTEVKCVKSQAEINISSGDFVDIYAHFTTATATDSLGYIVEKAQGQDQPNWDNIVANCTISRTGASTGWHNCSTSVTGNSLGYGHDFFICVGRPTYLSVNDHTPVGSFWYSSDVSLDPEPWTEVDIEAGIAAVFDNTLNFATSDSNDTCIYGIVYEDQTLEDVVVSGASIRATQGSVDYVGTSSATGSYTICGFSPYQPITLRAFAANYETYLHPFALTLTQNQSTEQNIYMSPLIKLGSIVMGAEVTGYSVGDKTTELRSKDSKNSVTLKSDSTIRSIGVTALTALGDAYTEDITVNVTTTCPFTGSTPTAWRMKNNMGGNYELEGYTSTWYRIINAECADGDYFEVDLTGNAIRFTGNYSFDNFHMKVKDWFAYNGTSYIYAGGYIYESEKESTLAPSSCTIGLLHPNMTSLSASATATIGDLTANSVTRNVTTTPISSVIIFFNCSLTGYDSLEFYSDPITLGTDFFDKVECGIFDTDGNRLSYSIRDNEIVHQCTFSTYNSATLSGMNVYVREFESNGDDLPLLYKPTLGSAGEYVFRKAVTEKNTARLYQRQVRLESVPSGIFYPTLSYSHKVIDSYTTPEILEFTNTPIVDKNGEYTCQVKVQYDGTLREQTAFLRVGSVDYDVRDYVAMSREGDVQTMKVSISPFGTIGSLPFNENTQTFSCFLHLEYECWDCDAYVGNLDVPEMASFYSAKDAFDMFGAFGVVRDILTSSDADETGAGAIVKSPFNAVSKIWDYIVDSIYGDPLTAIVIIVTIGIIAALIIVAMNQRKK